MQDTPTRTRRHWADVAVILVGLGLFGLAIWFPPFTTTTGASETTPTSAWPIYGSAGGLTLVALFLGQRWAWRTFARILLIAAVAILAYGLLSRFRELGPAAWLTVILPGIVLLLAAPFFGPMPRAAESPR